MGGLADKAEATHGFSAPIVAPLMAVLIKAKIRIFAPMIAIYLTGYIGLTGLAGFARGIMGLKVFGSLNTGFFLIACNYIVALVIALAYVHIANTTLDPMVQRIISALRQRAGR
jgi:uncharacterized membrane protein (DUF485 family)